MGALAVVAVAWLAFPYTVDDAFITARYAVNLARGLGYVLSPGGAPSDGVTGPLWLAPLVAAAALGLDPVAVAKILGAACMAATAALTLQQARSRAGGRVAGVAALAIVASSPSWGTWGVAGLETGAATLAFAIALEAALRRPRPAWAPAAVALGAVAWLRPELALAGGVLLVALWLRDARSGARAFALAGALVLGLVAFRLAAFGDPLPLSFHAKLGTFGHGVRDALLGAVLASSLVGVFLCAHAVRRGRSDDRVLGAVLLAHACGISLAGGDWMPGARLWVPLLPAYTRLAAVGASRLWRRPQGRRWALLGVVLACAVPALDLVVRVPELHAAGRSRDEAGAALAAWLGREARRVALVDVGYLGWASGCEVVDLAGLTDPEVARMPGGHLSKQVDERWLRERAPDVIVLHSRSRPRVSPEGRLTAFEGFPVEERIARFPWVHEVFSVARVTTHAPGYYYVVLKR